LVGVGQISLAVGFDVLGVQDGESLVLRVVNDLNPVRMAL